MAKNEVMEKSMTDDELDAVAGGSRQELCCLLSFYEKHGIDLEDKYETQQELFDGLDAQLEKDIGFVGWNEVERIRGFSKMTPPFENLRIKGRGKVTFNELMDALKQKYGDK